MTRRTGTLVLASLALVLAGLAGPVAAQAPSQEDPFPGPEAVEDRLDAFAEHPWVTVHRLGASVEDRPIRLAEITDPNGTRSIEERPVTLLITQQHGDEPAGTPAALRLIANITEGNEPAGWLANQVLLVLPMANPDGSAAGTRQNADGVDVNRDHIALDTPEARAIHEALNRWEVDVALDHHEYGGTGPGNPVPVRTYDYDLLTLFPRHGNVRGPTLTVAEALMYDAIWPQARDAGYSVNEYGEVTANGEPVDQIAGGPDPGILRNHLGLHNVAGLLVETRIDEHPNPFNPPERRVKIQRVVMDATLAYVHEHPDRFVDAHRESRELGVDLPMDRYIEGNRTGELARAYELPNATSLVETMHAHGIDPGEPTHEGYLHDTHHALQGHAAAIFHPASSRTVAEGTPTELPGPDRALTPTSEEANGTPLGLGAVVAALGAAIMLAGRGDPPDGQ